MGVAVTGGAVVADGGYDPDQVVARLKAERDAAQARIEADRNLVLRLSQEIRAITRPGRERSPLLREYVATLAPGELIDTETATLWCETHGWETKSRTHLRRRRLVIAQLRDLAIAGVVEHRNRHYYALTSK